MFAIGAHHLVERVAVRKLWVQLFAEFTESPGLNFESFADDGIDMFHEAGSGPSAMVDWQLRGRQQAYVNRAAMPISGAHDWSLASD